MNCIMAKLKSNKDAINLWGRSIEDDVSLYLLKTPTLPGEQERKYKMFLGDYL